MDRDKTVSFKNIWLCCLTWEGLWTKMKAVHWKSLWGAVGPCPSFPAETSSSPEPQSRTWPHAILWKPHPTFAILLFSLVPLRNLHGQKVARGRMVRMALYSAGQEMRRCSSGSFVPWGSCSNQCVETGLFACQPLELVCFVI